MSQGTGKASARCGKALVRCGQGARNKEWARCWPSKSDLGVSIVPVWRRAAHDTATQWPEDPGIYVLEIKSPLATPALTGEILAFKQSIYA